MQTLKQLKNEFQKITPKFGNEILKLISSKTDDGKIFPPYVPFVGKKYDNYKIMVYATAQNIGFNGFRDFYTNNFDKLTERLFYSANDFNIKYPNNKISYKEIAINPYKTGVIPSLIGVFLYANFGIKISKLDEINDLIGITNYYKFSLNSGNSDINPEGKVFKQLIRDNSQKNYYWKFNDNLVKKEIETLKPKFIIAFSGRKIYQLQKNIDNNTHIIEVNDPACIFRYSCAGKASKNGIWIQKAEKCKGSEINDLIDNYLNSIVGNFKGHKKYIRLYLLNYYYDWKNSNINN